jgi:hypothetical protein
MKFTIFGLVALTGTALASPYRFHSAVESPEDMKLDKAENIFSQLYTQVQQITGAISKSIAWVETF